MFDPRQEGDGSPRVESTAVRELNVTVSTAVKKRCRPWHAIGATRVSDVAASSWWVAVGADVFTSCGGTERINCACAANGCRTK